MELLTQDMLRVHQQAISVCYHHSPLFKINILLILIKRTRLKYTAEVAAAKGALDKTKDKKFKVLSYSTFFLSKNIL